VNGKVPTEHPKTPARRQVFALSILIGTRQDLWKFTYNPQERRRDLRISNWEAQAFVIKMVSSTY
jgi:hypothetical protein